MICHECSQPLIELGYDVEATLVGCFQNHLCGAEHDKNCVGRVAWCAAGHMSRIGLRRRCNDKEPQRSWGRDVGDTTPKCDWRGKEACSICRADVMVDEWPDLPVRPRKM